MGLQAASSSVTEASLQVLQSRIFGPERSGLVMMGPSHANACLYVPFSTTMTQPYLAASELL
jgi:hypothetical protein